jgi:ABC-type multidrug transport system ATPase subunit
VLFPVTLVVILVVIQAVVNGVFGGKFKCGCECVPNPNGGPCEDKCGLEYSDDNEAPFCGVPNPAPWPALLQIPKPQYMAVQSPQEPDLTQPASCRATGTCATSIPYTGTNKSTADSMASFLLSETALNLSDPLYSISQSVLGTSALPWINLLIESGFTSDQPLSVLRPSCVGSTDNNSSYTITAEGGFNIVKEFKCLDTTLLWRNNVSSINNMLYQGYRDGNRKPDIFEYPTAYDFGNTNLGVFDVNVFYNDTFANRTESQPSFYQRVSRSMNMASQAFLRFKLGPTASLPLLFTREMPKPETRLRLDFASLLGPLFYMWVLGFLFAVVLIALVYEKQYHLRMMMKMHGLSDSAYWSITYAYYVVLFCVYMICFIIFGSLARLSFFTKNDYSIQAVFYFLYINMIISFAFLISSVFRDAKTATVFGYLYVFGSGLLGGFLFENFVVDKNTSRRVVTALQIIPPFATYRGLYEFASYSFKAVYTGEKGMKWSNLNDSENDMKTVLIILAVEWIVFLLLTLYLDQVVSADNGIRKHPLFFLNFKRKGEAAKGDAALTTARSRRFSGSRRSMAHISSEDSKAKPDRADVARERQNVLELAASPSTEYPIVCDDLKRVYPARDGNPPKYAVKGFSLAVPKGECFGILGPNGAGKTSSINMMIGFLKPTAGTAYIQGMNILTEMDRIYACMGVCPQHDLLWGQLTGREHLLFYGRLKNLKGRALTDAVESSLRSVNLWDSGVADKQCRKYSGGMKRRLSVAISLIGNPQVVYMDEPSTGLDPASRYNLWNVVKQSKQDRAIILTTHSMEEAEALCDRLGIFVNGELQCIGNAKELTARYGGLYVLTMTTPQEREAEAMELAHSLTPNAKRIYALSGTQKFEMPKSEVNVATVFTAIEHAKERLQIKAWGLSDTTLEDVFIKVARSVNGGGKLQ